ncbi:MAG: hypothetical protein NZ956_01205 [Candidatus Caldarchaeum sp.]|nr:hypothetical protein [Candidatus Caldarchaeum sp.]
MGVVRLRTPPRVKVLEALGAVAGKRVKIVDENNCLVDASEGPRTYKVFVDLSNQMAQSDDNGTVFRDYVGYPIIAFLMASGKISYDEKIANPIASVKWRSLNERYKSYAKVESVVKNLLAKQGIKPEEVDEFVAKVLHEVETLGLRKQVI